MSLQYINERMQMLVCKMKSDIVKRSPRMLKMDMKWPLYELWRGWPCAVVLNTWRPTEQLSGKSAQSVTNTQTFVHENLNQHFSAPEEFFFFFSFLKRNTPANLPQSANTVVKLTGLPDLLHTFNTTCLQALVMNEPSRVAYAHNHKLDILDTSLQSGLKLKKKNRTKTKLCNNDIFPTHARGYIYKQQKTS